MRKMQKKQAEDFIRLLGQAHREVWKNIRKKEISAALALLKQCQEGVINLGNLIESSEGEGVVTIPILEEYCELVYQSYKEIAGEGSVSGSKVYKKLQKSLIQIQNSIKNDIKIHIEAVFLPYKASMWDSLESIWMAANEDPDCDAYVIPIPYFDKDPNGNLGQEHYEGSCYPDYVPITEYRAYDFEARQPDMIFIHNPYDNGNYVTSVHPFFYTSCLKRYTENLVYVPYFIREEISPKETAKVKRMEHFCTVFGVVNADKVIVQSEAMREIYVNVLSKYAGENTREYWKNKIVGLGSPKIEKVQNVDKKTLQVPDEWKKILAEKHNGRVVLYNTHLNLLMQTNYKQFIPKLKKTLDYFKGRNDIILLWRPHPLSMATAKSMNPYVSDEYTSIVDRYKREGWGIYDDTPDLGRAIALSDAYYGSVSSLLPLYVAAGKPVLIHNLNVVEEEEW